MDPQVDSDHYEFEHYVHKLRWASMWHQLDEVLALKPKRVLEIGPGPGVFCAVARTLGLDVETLDLDPALQPDHVASVFDMPFEADAFDVVCAFQMLEHLPFDKSLQALREMSRVAGRALVLSLPDSAVRWPVSIHVPTRGLVQFSIPKPRLRQRPYEYDGEHYWEVGAQGFSLAFVSDSIARATSMSLENTYRVPEHPYHRFFVYR